MNSKIVLALIILGLTALDFVSCPSNVRQINHNYSCCGQLTIEVEPDCNSSWNINDRPFAHYGSKFNRCKSPCKEIKGGRMTLDKCVNVSSTIVCENKNGKVDEKRINYIGQPCFGFAGNTSPRNQGSVVLLLLAVVTAGYFGNQMIC